ncbi:23219_t:CDS:2 [Gigaspora margarita]|uniref:23219_t:CDS:1 n=1 Tax=Gigaspora margarita TaxID=4874 RepID=A0ABN7UE20_GIGMA|nr:23219_t:CDS:2 [Gigaspora margarita]
MNPKKHREEDVQVAHLVKDLSLDESEWNKFDNQSMDMEYTRHRSKDDNVDHWEPNRYEIDHIIAHKVVNNLDDCREKLNEFYKLSDELKISDQFRSSNELDPEERSMFLNALQDSNSADYDLYDKIILGRTKNHDYLSEPRIESVPIAEIGERGQMEYEEKLKEDIDLYDLYDLF